VYIFPPMILCGQKKNFAHLCGAIDSARSARHPWLTNRLGDFIDLRGRAAARAANRQKCARGAQAVDWLDHGGGKATENSPAHRTANSTPLVHDDCPPRTI
jgi:hypothetical protein